MRSRLAVVGFFALAVGCASRPGSQRIIGPDGTAMAHVHCGSDQGSCFRLAGELCPNGYDLQPVLAGHDGNFLVRCRAPRADVAVATTSTCAPPAPSVAAAKPREAWPPSNEPWPATYPWPPPETSAAVQAPPASQPSKPPVEIDLGY